MRKLFAALVCLFSFLIFTYPVLAIENPLGKPNNIFGIHILFPSEVDQASHLVNSSGGDWGYIVIPIQAGDRNLQKWQSFMNSCARDHLIPIIRLATEGDYFNTTVWRKPTDEDVLDFANFLSSLDWPTKNRFVIVFNEVNRNDEWGGQASPSDYANLLSFAVTTFKTKSPDFFIISAGMDNAAPNSNTSFNEYTFYSDMNNAVPGIFNQIDGFASHSYPNPAFIQPPTVATQMSIASFSFEKSLLDSLSSKTLPVFITETGWDTNAVGQQTAASYFSQAFSNVWNDPSIVMVSPFLLSAGTPPFATFSFLDSSGSPNSIYTTISQLPKTKGQPTINQAVLAAALLPKKSPLPTEDFGHIKLFATNIIIPPDVKTVLKWFLHFPLP